MRSVLQGAEPAPTGTGPQTPDQRETPDVPDLTGRARIRDAALLRFASEGFRVPVRTIAADAGVSPGLVIHHFGSKEGLRRACDEHVLVLIRENKRNVLGDEHGSRAARGRPRAARVDRGVRPGARLRPAQPAGRRRARPLVRREHGRRRRRLHRGRGRHGDHQALARRERSRPVPRHPVARDDPPRPHAEPARGPGRHRVRHPGVRRPPRPAVHRALHRRVPHRPHAPRRLPPVRRATTRRAGRDAGP